MEERKEITTAVVIANSLDIPEKLNFFSSNSSCSRNSVSKYLQNQNIQLNFKEFLRALLYISMDIHVLCNIYSMYSIYYP